MFVWNIQNEFLWFLKFELNLQKKNQRMHFNFRSTCSMLLVPTVFFSIRIIVIRNHRSYGISVISHSQWHVSPTSLFSNTFDIHSWEHIQLWSWDCFYSCYLYTNIHHIMIPISPNAKCVYIFYICAVLQEEKCSIIHIH